MSFEILEPPYSKDKYNAYYTFSKIEKSDPITFQVINYQYSKDKNKVYLLGREVPEADPETFDLQISQVIRMIQNISLMTPELEVKVSHEDKQILLEGE